MGFLLFLVSLVIKNGRINHLVVLGERKAFQVHVQYASNHVSLAEWLQFVQLHASVVQVTLGSDRDGVRM